MPLTIGGSKWGVNALAPERFYLRAFLRTFCAIGASIHPHYLWVCVEYVVSPLQFWSRANYLRFGFFVATIEQIATSNNWQLFYHPLVYARIIPLDDLCRDERYKKKREQKQFTKRIIRNQSAFTQDAWLSSILLHKAIFYFQWERTKTRVKANENNSQRTETQLNFH